MPKHIMLAMTVRHLTESSEIVTILNRFGHCLSYTKLLELETAMCNSIFISDTVLPPVISADNNAILHFAWDNFDLNEETPSGSGTTHSTHGIIIQEVKDHTVAHIRPLPEVPKTRQRTVQPRQVVLNPCFAKAKVEPNLNVTTTSPVSISNYCRFRISDFFMAIE